MNRHPNPFRSERRFPNQGRPRYRRLEADPELLELEEQLRAGNLLEDPEVQRWMRIASFGTHAGRSRNIERLRALLQAQTVEAMRAPDAFRPYGPASLLAQGDLHLLDQMDGVPWLVSTDALLTGTVVAGAQGGGKTRLIVSLLRQLTQVRPPRRFTVIDPKGQLAPYAPYLDAVALDARQVAFDLAPPPGTDYETWLSVLMPQLGGVCGLIQGIELCGEAAEIALGQLRSYRRHTGQDAELCLHDIYNALPLVPDIRRGRREGYFQAAHTGTGRMVRGAGGMFSCRKGLPLQDLFEHNVILSCPHLTDPLSCRWLAQHLLCWKYQGARDKPETNRLDTLLVIDDAQRFLVAPGWQSDASREPTPLAHVLAVLRSSGSGVLTASQLPARLDPNVPALSSLILTVGGIHGYRNQRAVADQMGLNRNQQEALGRLQTREAVGFYARGAYREPVHGWVPQVPDPQGI
ncbi:MAG: hypothetical protein R6X20_17655 [Phycisphaerae bacterium]